MEFEDITKKEIIESVKSIVGIYPKNDIPTDEEVEKLLMSTCITAFYSSPQKIERALFEITKTMMLIGYCIGRQHERNEKLN